MKALPCLGKVERGDFIPENPNAFKAAFYGHEGKRVKVTIERFRNMRSGNQNAYYWAVVVPMIGEAIGEDDKNEVHDLLRAQFNYEILVIGEQEIRKPKSTAKLDTTEFSAYIESVRRWASKFLSLYIPDAGE